MFCPFRTISRSASMLSNYRFAVRCFCSSVRATVDVAGRTKLDFNATEPNLHAFKIIAPDDYSPALRDSLRELFRTFPPPR